MVIKGDTRSLDIISYLAFFLTPFWVTWSCKGLCDPGVQPKGPKTLNPKKEDRNKM